MPDNMPAEPDFLTLTRVAYDRTAAAYAERFHHHLDGKPVDLAVLSVFAGLVRQGDTPRVLDVGCGTGVSTALLAGAGLEVEGIDLSPNMVSEARRLNRGMSFRVGSMSELDVADGSVGGLCAWYSIIHVPDSHLAAVFAEFHRVLSPGGLVLLAFQVGDEPRVLTEAFGERVHLTFLRRRPDWVAKRLSDNGFRIYAELVRQPDDDGLESTPQAFVIARRAA
ncbi:ubiquinone/menaquinone biosynthesis C-methylase UbiE [Mycobacterium sp. MAA66]|uniref:class I SAM-dependent DNA methyltransferase n=1 Tax=Mycobacterium sp. MAA66 TaxID=3156297 RepID=UPI0035190116